MQSGKLDVGSACAVTLARMRELVSAIKLAWLREFYSRAAL
jgi:hypothetical protein